MNPKDIPEEDIEYVSKSELKREVEALQKLGQEIAALSDSKFEKLDLPTQLREAISEFRRLKKHEAKRRQMQFIGKIMRGVDAQAIELQMKVFRHEKRFANQYFHKLENLRDQLLNGEESAIQSVLELAEGLDRQQLRTYVRNAKKEAANNKPPKHARQLFQYLKEHISPD